ncbi:MAG: hypothetical protein K5695_07915 [Oscillospiraceae bacterium]|nr:hypothetical protein [Oscillospiraceae bacterium]
MKTDVIQIRGDLSGYEDAVEAAERFIAYHDVTGTDAMHLRLLTEEVISMVHGIFDDFTARIWLESKRTPKGLWCRICLSADKNADVEQETKILSVATSGRNENEKGILGKIRELLRISLQSGSSEDEAYLRSLTSVLHDQDNPVSNVDIWSLQDYRQSLSEMEDQEEWDEMERSIIANLADEVKVWLKSDETEVVIEKYIA